MSISQALEVYERLVKADDRDAPDLVIGGEFSLTLWLPLSP
jgi:hypothetical protein